MKNFIYIAILYIFSMCGNSKSEVEIEGNVYVKLIDVHSFYGFPQDKLDEYKTAIYEQATDTLTDSEKQLHDHVIFLIENDMYEIPHFKMKVDDEIINVYATTSEFSKLKPQLEDLDREKEKITVRFKGTKKSDGYFGEPLYLASKIISVEKTSGYTEWDK